MKKILSLIITTIFISGAVIAQNKPKTDQKPVKADTLKTKDKSEKGLTEEKIKHAEERSNGKAFSGKGHGAQKGTATPAPEKKEEKVKVKEKTEKDGDYKREEEKLDKEGKEKSEKKTKTEKDQVKVKKTTKGGTQPFISK